MANAKKCDRCDKYYDVNTEHTPEEELHVTNYIHNRGGYTFDLCDDCIKDLKLFLKGAPVQK